MKPTSFLFTELQAQAATIELLLTYGTTTFILPTMEEFSTSMSQATNGASLTLTTLVTALMTLLLTPRPPVRRYLLLGGFVPHPATLAT